MVLFNYKLTILVFGILTSVSVSITLHPYVIPSNIGPPSCKVYLISISTRADSDFLYNISLKNKAIDIWLLTKLPNTVAQIMVSPQHQKDFENKLKSNGLRYKVILDELSNMKLKLYEKPTEQMDIFNKFYRHSELNAYLDNLLSKYYKRVSLKTIGYSYENRSIRSITITNGASNFKDKKVIFVDAGIHARDWIAPSTALYVIYQLVENFYQNRHLLEHYDWIVIPSTNPDGYEYTHTNHRCWKKTRKPSSSASLYCYGTDGNINFDYHWGEGDAASSGPCDDTYKGDKPFSEPETQIIRDVLLSLSGRGKMYLTLHAYGRLLLYPWGYTSNFTENWRELDEVARSGANAILNSTSASYIVGPSAYVVHSTAGSSTDYALGVAKFPIAITMVLPPTLVLFTVNPDPSQIEGMVKESWIGIKAMAEKVIEKY